MEKRWTKFMDNLNIGSHLWRNVGSNLWRTIGSVKCVLIKFSMCA